MFYILEPTLRYELFATISIAPILQVVGKKIAIWSTGNTELSSNSPFINHPLCGKDQWSETFIKRLKDDEGFKRDCGFGVAYPVPSEASFSRVVKKIKGTDVLKKINHQIVHEAKREPKKRGRKRICKIDEIKKSSWGLSSVSKKLKNSDCKKVFWYGFKGHIAVETSSQFILEFLLSSGNLNDWKAAIPLLKGIYDHYPPFQIGHATMEAGYDYPAIYELIHRMNDYSVMAYNKRNEPETLGFNNTLPQLV